MKLGIISDIHVDYNWEKNDTIEAALLTVIKEKSLDTLIIAGDISNNYQKSLETISYLEEQSSVRCLFVPGNHDLWNLEHPEITSSSYIYDCLRMHPGNLSRGPVHLNAEYSVVGDVGWYDYTYGINAYTKEQYNKGFHLERQWKDKDYIHWDMSDIDMTQVMFNRLKDQILSLKDKKIIFVTHMITHPFFLVPLPNPLWEYFNAFLGSSRFELLFYPNVRHIIMGHVHYRKNHYKGGKSFYCRCLGYRSEWANKQAIEEVSEALDIIEI